MNLNQICINQSNLNSHETNPHLLRLNQLNEARIRWNESEWLLNFLRTKSSIKPKTQTDEELLASNQQLH